MIHDARRLEEGARLDYDLCVVGAGAAGITLAREFLGCGTRVCVLESGGLAPRPDSQELAEAENVGRAYFPIRETRLRRFGGTTGLWHGECRPLDAADLAPRPRLGHRGWPLGMEELGPFYVRAQLACGLGPAPFDPAEPWLDEAGYGALPLDPGRFVTRIFRFSPVRDFGRSHAREFRRAANVDVFLNATVTAIETDDRGARVVGLRVTPAPARTIVVGVRLVVLAAGGIENARLLLASDRVRPRGLGNDLDQVGRCFMEHLFFDDVARLEPTATVPAARLYDRRSRLAGTSFRAALAPTASLLEEAGMLNCCFKLASPTKRRPGLVAAMELRDRLRRGVRPLEAGRMLRVLATDFPGTAGALLGLGRDLRGRPRPLLVSAVSEQAPNPESRVTLSPRRDALGQPLARLDWRLTEIDRTSWLRGLDALAWEVARAGLGRVVLPRDQEETIRALERMRGGRHHMGTTRMADDPRDGVVDRHARVHGVGNLYVAGSSVFPTSGHANPTLTLVALAIRLADRLKRLV